MCIKAELSSNKQLQIKGIYKRFNNKIKKIKRKSQIHHRTHSTSSKSGL